MIALTLLLAATPAPVLAEVDTLWRDRTPASYRANAQKVIDRLKPHAKQFEAAASNCLACGLSRSITFCALAR